MEYLVADPFGCPVHYNGYPSTERRCSCGYYWSDDPNRKDNIIATGEDSPKQREEKIEKYETA